MLDLLVLERALEGLVRLGVAGEQQAARRVAVEPVDRQRQPLETETKIGEDNLPGSRACAIRMDGEAGRLVDHDRLAVDEKDAVLLARECHGRRPCHLRVASFVQRVRNKCKDSSILIPN